jgi:hypothetical protein
MPQNPDPLRRGNRLAQPRKQARRLTFKLLGCLSCPPSAVIKSARIPVQRRLDNHRSIVRRTPRFPERPCGPDVARQRLVGLCSGDIARARPSSTAAASVGSSSGAPAVKAGSSTSNAATAGTHPPGPPAGHSDLVRARGIHPQPGQDQRPCQLTCPGGPENAANIVARDQPPDFFRSKQFTRISEPHRSPGQGQESSSGTLRSVDRFG